MLNDLFDKLYKPDVLSCLADLSNDEVMTPPDIANKMLDLLPLELFSNPDTKILDPFCKSGVFLREAAKRFIEGEKNQFNSLQECIDWVFQHQLYGIAITELTSLLSRRSVYCSKYPNSPYSVSVFDKENAQGNILYHKMKHEWEGTGDNRHCKYCGASAKEFDRADGLETHAYELIHTVNPKEIFNMKFDVIIGNPPYQISDGGGDGSSAKPIYHHFIEQAKLLNAKYLVMIVPARWYSGGKGLDSFRDSMLHDDRLSVIHDFPETSDCFPGLNIRGGVCYFMIDREHHGDCLVVNHKSDTVSEATRPLLEDNVDTFIRYNAAIPILKKVQAYHEETMDSKVSSRLPFGIPSDFDDYVLEKDAEHSVVLYRSDRNKNSEKKVYINSSHILKNENWKNKIKVLVSKASPGGDEYPHAVISEPVIAGMNSVCTETYLIVDFVANKEEAANLVSYMKTKFFRFMMSLVKNTQNISKSVFCLVPVQDWTKPWTDEELFDKYQISEKEIGFINSMVRPME